MDVVIWPHVSRDSKKGHVENRLRNVRTKKLKIFIIDIVDLGPIAETV